MNFDNRSMALNDESTLMVHGRGIGAQMIRLFFDDLQHATELQQRNSVAGCGAIASPTVRQIC